MLGRNGKLLRVLVLLVLVVTMVILASTNLGENVNKYAKELAEMHGSKGMEGDESSHEQEFELKENIEGIPELRIEQDDKLSDKKTIEKGQQKPDPELTQENKGQNKDDKKSKLDDLKKKNKDDEISEPNDLNYKGEIVNPKNPHGFLGGMEKEERVNKQPENIAKYIKPDTTKGPASILPVPYAEIQNPEEIKPLKFRIYSHNVKNGGHSNLVPGELQWKDRYQRIAASIKFNAQENTIVALQEVYKFMLDDILFELNRYGDEWKAYGAGRIDGEETGEFVPVIYRSKEWEVINQNTLWLNEKDEQRALEGWDAKYLRIVSYVTLCHRETNNFINIFNTHFDHEGSKARLASAKQILKHMTKINAWPSFLCGDLNSEPQEEPYEALSQYLEDLAGLVTKYNHYGHVKSSVTGFEGQVLETGGQNIDYIFAPKYTSKASTKCSKSQSQLPIHLSLLGYGMLHSKYEGTYMSDHRPIVGDFFLQNECKEVEEEKNEREEKNL